jgi:hypothetical protein
MGNLNNGTAAAVREQDSKLKQGQPGIIRVMVPRYVDPSSLLPPTLPNTAIDWFGYYSPRDIWTLAAARVVASWGNAMGIAVNKKASMRWEVDGERIRLAKRARELLLNAGAGMGIFGWVPFLQMGLQSYYGTSFQFVEISRASAARGSHITGVHHLNPMRCRLTGDALHPVNFLGYDGQVRSLAWHEVMIIADMPDPTEGELGISQPAAATVWQRIVIDQAIERYIYERVTATQPHQISIMGGNGVIQTRLQDSLDRAKEETADKGYVNFMNHLLVDIPVDVPLNVHTIDISGIPDKTDIERERLRSDLMYAHALHLDPQEVNPQLVGRQGLGSTGNQAQVLHQKASGRQTWEQNLVHNLNEILLDDKTMFSFTEVDLRDELAAAEGQGVRIANQNAMITTGIITPEIAANNLVDSGDLDPAYVAEDMTEGGTVASDAKPKNEQEGDAAPNRNVVAAAPDDEEE